MTGETVTQVSKRLAQKAMVDTSLEVGAICLENIAVLPVEMNFQVPNQVFPAMLENKEVNIVKLPLQKQHAVCFG